uniref:Putative ovule protein n=1 Tax=Solanum chacoense TaxID=4108 RepID=A0A0V0H3R9_SOLCH
MTMLMTYDSFKGFYYDLAWSCISCSNVLICSCFMFSYIFSYFVHFMYYAYLCLHCVIMYASPTPSRG